MACGVGRHVRVRRILERAGVTNRDEQNHRMHRYGMNPCAEIIGANFHCNLAEVHLDVLAPGDQASQKRAFRAAAIMATLMLRQRLPFPRHQFSRDIDPTVGVSFTGLFDFLVNAFGLDWTCWMMEGRPDEWKSPAGIDYKAQERS